MSDGSSPRAGLARLFTNDAVVVEAAPALVDELLMPEEWAYIRQAVPKRRAEFGTARVLARRALAMLGFPPKALVPRPDRSPDWPPGVVGSITHTAGYCAVVVHRSPPMRSVGVDVEQVAHLEETLLVRILTASERAWLAAQSREDRRALAILFFSAKEAYYKCQFPLSRTLLDFLDVEITFDLAAERFRARSPVAGLPSEAAQLDGRFAIGTGKVMCGVECRAADEWGSPLPARSVDDTLR